LNKIKDLNKNPLPPRLGAQRGGSEDNKKTRDTRKLLVDYSFKAIIIKIKKGGGVPIYPVESKIKFKKSKLKNQKSKIKRIIVQEAVHFICSYFYFGNLSFTCCMFSYFY
jgi:adenine-specific DNA methylase